MGAGLGAAVGGLLGGLGGGLASQREGGTDTGNIYALKPGQADALKQNYLQNLMGIGSAYTGGTEGMKQATQDVQDNAILGGLFGPQGTLQRTGAEEQQLASRGFTLQPEDYEAYGQGAGDIARMFGQSDQSLAQSLANRGLSSSGVAGSAFSGSMGNKQEQLAGLQMKIANQRMQNNLARLSETRQFLGQLGAQGEQAIQNQFGNITEGNREARAAMGAKSAGIMGLLGAGQEQANTALGQQMATQHESRASDIFGGALAGAGAGGRMGAGMSGGGPMSGAKTMQPMAGQSGYSGGTLA